MEQLNDFKHLPPKEFDELVGEMLKKKMDADLAQVKPKAKKTVISGKK